MTRTLDLRTGRPVWMAYRAPSVPCTRLRRDTRTDVLVVGMGVSGAMVAESLTAAGFRVILRDRRRRGALRLRGLIRPPMIPIAGGELLGVLRVPASTAREQVALETPHFGPSRELVGALEGDGEGVLKGCC